jgi:predicted transcriptional regulator
MSTSTKTTVYLNQEDYQRLKTIARRAGRAPAELVREAVAEYVRRKQPARARSVGAGRSGRKNLSERAEALLAGMGRNP